MKPLGHVLFDRLRATGVDTTFGIPGDFALPLYAAQAEAGMRTVVCTHEPNVVFAAIAYARLKRLGVALTTYGAGGLNLINPVAMAYAEFSPVLVVSGAPEVEGRSAGGLQPHHLVKDYGTQRRIFDEVCCATAALEHPETAVAEIDRVIATVMAEKRPGYLELPRDLTAVPVEAPPPPAPEPAAGVHAPALAECVAELHGLLQRAERPVLYVGVGVRRNNLLPAVTRLAEAWGMPVVTSIMGKASFPESHPQFAGVYMGALGPAGPRDAMERADLVLDVGVINSDVNTGFQTAAIPVAKRVALGERSATVFHHRYDGVPMGAVVQALAEHPPAQRRPPVAGRPAAAPAAPPAGGPLRTAQLVQRLQRLDPARYAVLTDIGDAWFVGLELQADVFMASGYYASMGFAVPGGLGAALAAPELRPFILVGDGAFQMTGMELATLANLDIPAIVVVLNNGSYKMLEALDQPREYYSIANWDYVGLAHSLGCDGERTATAADLDAALNRAEAASRPYLIEAVLDPHDHAPIMQQIQAFTAERKAQRQAADGQEPA